MMSNKTKTTLIPSSYTKGAIHYGDCQTRLGLISDEELSRDSGSSFKGA